MVLREYSPALVHAIGGVDPGRRRLSRAATIAIGVSIAAHLALGFYLYEAKYITIAPPAPTPDAAAHQSSTRDDRSRRNGPRPRRSPARLRRTNPPRPTQLNTASPSPLQPNKTIVVSQVDLPPFIGVPAVPAR